MYELMKPSDKVTLLAKLDPVSQAAGTVTTGWVKASDFHQHLFELLVGALGAAATVDAKIQQATDGAGTGAKDVAGAAITQLTKAGADDNKVVDINLDPNKLDVANRFDYVRLSVTVGTAACLIAATHKGMHPRYGVGAHIAAMDEVVSVF
jgi:hypothetical protein